MGGGLGGKEHREHKAAPQHVVVAPGKIGRNFDPGAGRQVGIEQCEALGPCGNFLVRFVPGSRRRMPLVGNNNAALGFFGRHKKEEAMGAMEYSPALSEELPTPVGGIYGKKIRGNGRLGFELVRQFLPDKISERFGQGIAGWSERVGWVCPVEPKAGENLGNDDIAPGWAIAREASGNFGQLAVGERGNRAGMLGELKNVRGRRAHVSIGDVRTERRSWVSKTRPSFKSSGLA